MTYRHWFQLVAFRLLSDCSESKVFCSVFVLVDLEAIYIASEKVDTLVEDKEILNVDDGTRHQFGANVGDGGLNFMRVIPWHEGGHESAH
eukprot:18141_3